MAGIKMIITVILALVGLFYLATPHEIHVSSGLGFGLEHPVHMLIGVVLLVIAFLMFKMKK